MRLGRDEKGHNGPETSGVEIVSTPLLYVRAVRRLAVQVGEEETPWPRRLLHRLFGGGYLDRHLLRGDDGTRIVAGRDHDDKDPGASVGVGSLDHHVMGGINPCGGCTQVAWLTLAIAKVPGTLANRVHVEGRGQGEG